MPKREREIERLSGKATREVVKRGTAGEHNAVVLKTKRGVRLILQRIGGNPFDDAETKRLAGHDVSVEGFRLGDIFRFVKAERSDEK